MIQWLSRARWTTNIFSRNITTYQALCLKANQLPPRPKINENEIEEVFIKGGGNGGQKINKTNSKVQLKHIPTGIVVSSQFSRSREDNRKRARNILALKVEELLTPPGQSRNEIVAEFKRKKAKNRKKKSKRKYRKLALEKQEAEMREKEGEATREEGTDEKTEDNETDIDEHESDIDEHEDVEIEEKNIQKISKNFKKFIDSIDAK